MAAAWSKKMPLTSSTAANPARVYSFEIRSRGDRFVFRLHRGDAGPGTAPQKGGHPCGELLAAAWCWPRCAKRREIGVLSPATITHGRVRSAFSYRGPLGPPAGANAELPPTVVPSPAGLLRGDPGSTVTGFAAKGGDNAGGSSLTVKGGLAAQPASKASRAAAASKVFIFWIRRVVERRLRHWRYWRHAPARRSPWRIDHCRPTA